MSKYFINLAILVVTTFNVPFAHAILGPTLESSKNPEQVCEVIALPAGADDDQTRICTATLVTSTTLLTTLNCTREVEIKSIHCDNAQMKNLEVESVESRIGLGAIHLKQEIKNVKPMSFALTAEDKAQFIDPSNDDCRISGYGKYDAIAGVPGLALDRLQLKTAQIVSYEPNYRAVSFPGSISLFDEPGRHEVVTSFLNGIVASTTGPAATFTKPAADASNEDYLRKVNAALVMTAGDLGAPMFCKVKGQYMMGAVLTRIGVTSNNNPPYNNYSMKNAHWSLLGSPEAETVLRSMLRLPVE